MRADPGLYPANLLLRGASALVVGGGAVALRKLKGLPRGLERVRVAAPQISPRVRAWARGRPEAELVERAFRPSDLRGCRLVFCCSDSAEANAAAARLALRRGLWVCQAAEPSQGNLSVPALVRAGGVLLTLSTGGASPALARALRAHFEARLRASDLGWLLAQLRLRRARMKSDPSYKAKLLKRVTGPRAVAAALAPRTASGRRRLALLLKP